MSDLANRHVLITGGGTGTGAAMAAAFAEAGARVSICGRSLAPLVRVADGHASISAFQADVSDEAAVKSLYGRTGPVDIVIANAGASASAPFARTGMDLWQQMISVNLTGVFLTLREGLRQMTGWGRLIAISSTAGLEGFCYVSAYCAAKHGVVGLVRALGCEVAGSEITANALCPGFIETPMLARTIANIMDKTGMDEKQARQSILASGSQERFVRPGEVAAAALGLCGAGSGASNGEAIVLDGGQT